MIIIAHRFYKYHYGESIKVIFFLKGRYIVLLEKMIKES